MNGFNQTTHCLSCFKGSLSRQFNTRTVQSGKLYTMDERETFRYLYICGVGVGPKNLLRDKNFHLPLAYRAGGHEVHQTYNGYRITVENGVALPIPELESGWKGLDLETTRCKNFRFAVEQFGWIDQPRAAQNGPLVWPEMGCGDRGSLAPPPPQCFTVAVSGVPRDDPPTKNLYSPGSSSQSSFCSLKIERNFGSSVSVTVFASPGASGTFSQATRPLGRFLRGGRQSGINLRDLRAGALAGVAHGERDAVHAGFQSGIRVGGVGKAIAKGE